MAIMGIVGLEVNEAKKPARKKKARTHRWWWRRVGLPGGGESEEAGGKKKRKNKRVLRNAELKRIRTEPLFLGGKTNQAREDRSERERLEQEGSSE